MFANLTDVRCYYELLGTGDPLILVPGLGSTCALWDCVASEFANTFSLVLVDNRGVGRSIAKRTPKTLADVAVDLIELMDHLQLERAHVCGISLGGVIAQQLAVDHPDRVDRLVLVSCTNRFGPYLREVARLLAHALRRFPSEVFQRTVQLMGTAPAYLDAHADEIDELVARARESGVSRLAVARQLRCLACYDTDDLPDFRITAPTLVVAGEQDMLIPACYARRMAADIPGSEFLLMKECGHNPFTEQPDLIVPRVTEFLMRSRAGGSQAAEDERLFAGTTA